MLKQQLNLFTDQADDDHDKADSNDDPGSPSRRLHQRNGVGRILRDG